MSLKRILAVHDRSFFADLALLLLRVVVGVAFMKHGWSKIQHPFSWMGPEGFAPAPFQALAALSEFGGGLAWALGLLTPLASMGIACTMGVAIWMHAFKRGDPFVSLTGGPAFELAAVYFSVAMIVLSFGAGRFSLDRILFGSRTR